MKNSIEYTIEQYVIELLSAHAALRGKSIVHFDESDKAKSNCIVVEGTQDERQLEGPRGRRVLVVAEYRSDTGSKQANDIVADAMHEAITGAQPGRTDIESNFQDLYIFDEEMTGERRNTKSLRKREIRVPILANLK